MKLKKLIKVISPHTPINVYRYGEYLGQFSTPESIANSRLDLDTKVDGVSAMALQNGRGCLQVFLESEND